MFKSDKLFGEWLEQLRVVARDIPHDKQNMRSRLIMAVTHLSEQGFLELGYSKVAELMDKSMWKDHSADMEGVGTSASNCADAL